MLKLLLPRSVKNARMRLNDTNACVVEPTRGIAIAGVRRDIFVWSLEKQELLRNVTRGHPYMTSALRGDGGLAQKKM